MSISWFSVVILLIVAVIAFIEIHRGVRQGFFPTLISLGAMIPSILLALLIASPVAKGIIDPIFNNMLQPSDLYTMLVDVFPSIEPFLLAALQAVGSLLMFVVCFALCRLALRLVFSAYIWASLSSDEEDPGYYREKVSFCQRHSALLGGITGGVCALIVSMVITCPFMGALRVAGDVIDMAERYDPNLWSMTTLSQEDVDTIKALPDDLPGNVLYELGGKYMFQAAAKTEIYGETVSLHAELEHIEAIFSHLPAVSAVLDNPAGATVEQIAHLKGFRDDLYQLKLLRGIIADYFSCCAQAWLSDCSYYGFSKPKMNPITEPLMQEILLVCAESNGDTATANTTTLLNFYIFIFESDLLSIDAYDYINILSCLESTQLIPQLETELAKNPNMDHLRISSVGMQLWGGALKALNCSESKLANSGFYAYVADSLNTVHNRGYGSSQEKIAVLRTYLDKYFSDLQIVLPEVLADAIATELIHLTAADGEFTSEQIQEFFHQYT